MDRMRVNLPYLSEEIDRHGVGRIYVRRFGKRVRIRGVLGSPEFLTAYRTAVEQLSGPTPAKAAPSIIPAPVGSLGWLRAQYFASSEFLALDPVSQKRRRSTIDECCRTPHSDGDPETLAHCPLQYITSQKIKRLRDLKVGKPGAANNRRKYLSAMFGWAVEAGHMSTNPARDVRRVNYATDGFHTWTIDEVRQFESFHPIGSRARLALALMLLSGVRRGDLVTLGRQHIRDGWLRFVPRKTRYRRKRMSEKPVLPQLASVIEASQCGQLSFLVTEYGKPFSAAGFGNWFRERCNEAGLPHCTAHGLRKAGATIAAENGATTNQLMAMFDWDTPGQAKVYTDKADRKRMAGDAMGLIVAPAKMGETTQIKNTK